MDLKLVEVTSLIIFNKKQFLDFIHQMVFNLIFYCVTVQAKKLYCILNLLLIHCYVDIIQYNAN